MRRHELSDEAFALIEPLLPKNGARGGRPWKNHRLVLNGIFFRLSSGIAWRDLPERYGPWQTIYDRFNYFRKLGLWDRIADVLKAELNQRDEIACSVFNVDATTVRATRAAAGARKKNQPRGSSRRAGR